MIKKIQKTSPVSSVSNLIHAEYGLRLMRSGFVASGFQESPEIKEIPLQGRSMVVCNVET